MDKDTFYSWIQNPHLLTPATLESLEKLTVQYPQFQAAWVLYLKNLKVTGHPRFDEVLKKAAPLLPDRKWLYRYLNDENAGIGPGKVYTDSTPPPVADYSLGNEEKESQGNSLIDRFLASSSTGRIRPVPPAEEQKQAADTDPLAKSVNEDDELVTETLANIYLAQKKYDKALEAFKKLTLKYPEKNSYFAGRIEEIIKLKNT